MYKRARCAGLAVAGLLVVTCANESGAADVPQVLQPLLERKAAIAADLAGTVRRCVARKDTGHAAFHGCIDWHSAVHGVWALIAYTRMTGDRQDVALIASTLDSTRIAAERALLRSQPAFEMPYGRAWFLRLAIEHKLAFGTDAVRPMADEMLASMLAFYARHNPDPRRGSYNSDSWALINMHDYAVATGNADAVDAVRRLVGAHFLSGEEGCDHGTEVGNFMAVCTNWAWLVSKVLSPAEFKGWAGQFLERSALPAVVVKPVNWHHHGLNFSRAWGLWDLYAATKGSEASQLYLEAYVAHFRASYEQPQQWRGDYRSVGHWVPQFGLFALQPLYGAERGR